MSIKIGSNVVAGLPLLDSELSLTSDRAVKNSTITAAINEKVNDSVVAHNTGDETISGTKTFTGAVVSTASIIRKDMVNSYSDVPENDVIVPIYWQDAYNINYGTIETIKKTNGNNEIRLNVKGINGSTSNVTLGIGVDTDNNAYAFAPTPVSLSSNDNSIATTAWVNNKFQIVNALPVNPDADTFYCIPE